MKRFSTAALAIAATAMLTGSASAASYTNFSDSIDITEAKKMTFWNKHGVNVAWDNHAVKMDVVNGTVYYSDQSLHEDDNGIKRSNIVKVENFLYDDPTVTHIGNTKYGVIGGNKHLTGLAADADGNVFMSYRGSCWHYDGKPESWIGMIDTVTPGYTYQKIGSELKVAPAGAAYNPYKNEFNFLASGHKTMYTADAEGNVTESANIFDFTDMGNVPMAMDFDSEGNAVAIFNRATKAATVLYMDYDAASDSYTTSVVDTFTGNFSDGYEIEIVNGIGSDPMFAISGPGSLDFGDFTTASTTAVLIDNEGNRVASFLEGKGGGAVGLAYDITTQTLYTSPAYNKEVIAFDLTAVPEPASIALLGLGGVALLARRRK